MKFAVIGAAGQLGRDLCPRLTGEVLPLDRTGADLTNAAMLRATLGEERPDVVVNCAAYNFVDKAESEPDAAFAVNAWGVRQLARICRELDCALVHFSSDYVFGLDARRSTPYRVSDAPGPLSVYAMSKLAGEYSVRAECPKHFVIRTCGLYGVWGSGGKGGNFVETMLRIAGQGKPLRVVNDQHCTPSYTADVAVATANLIATGKYGLYHVTNAGATTWYELAKAAFEVAGVKADLTPIPTSDYPTPARRPLYSVLALDALAEAGVPTPRPWRDAVAEYLRERKTRSS
ncbi:MAG TPA: dTDP-4-dehydrorhamnose reductase [Gemmataceae bacterium]|nr:dTDP-4-dehydrorhamnose reductase [Gemmataceae bacterium]